MPAPNLGDRSQHCSYSLVRTLCVIPFSYTVLAGAVTAWKSPLPLTSFSTIDVGTNRREVIMPELRETRPDGLFVFMGLVKSDDAATAQAVEIFEAGESVPVAGVRTRQTVTWLDNGDGDHQGLIYAAWSFR